MKNKVFKALMVLIVSGLFIPSVLADNPPTTPGTPKANIIKFTKIQIFWTESTDDVGLNGYKVFRDGVEIAQTNETNYMDTGLTAGTEHIYKVKAEDVFLQESPASDELVVRTLTALTGDDAQDVMDAVDAIDPGGKTADELVTAVQNAFVNLGYDPTLDNIQRSILIEMIEKQVDIVNASVEAPEETPETRADNQAALDQLLNDYYNSNSGLSVYTYANLRDLAEKHFKAGKIDSALLIYEHSLKYLSDVEANVFNTLSRMAAIQLSAIDEDYTAPQKILALRAAEDTLMRFFDFFPNSTSHFAEYVNVKIAFNYFDYFPELLAYNSYFPSVYNTAVDRIKAAKTIKDNTINATRFERISSWELDKVSVSIKNTSGDPVTGSITVKNISDESKFPTEPVPDERTITIDSAIKQFSIYKGHTYSAKLAVNISGGEPWILNFSEIPHARGKKYTYDNSSGPVVTDLPDSDAIAEVIFVVNPPSAPYNLTSEAAVDKFTLSWDWVSPAGFTLKEFKVYRAGNEIGTVTTKYLSNIPLDIGDNTFTYTVKAFDTSGNASDESEMLEVLPEFSALQQAYYEWKLLHFGTDPVDDDGDADGDGITNYQEFLLGSNPNLAPVDDVKSTITDAVQGLNAEYFNYIANGFPNFGSMTPFSSEVVKDFTFDWHYGNVLGSGLSGHVAVRLTGYMDIATDGFYRFYHKSASNSKVYIDGNILFNNDKSWSDEIANDLYLRAGVHSIEIQYYNSTGGAQLKLDWAGPGFAREEVPQSVLWYTPNPTALLAETIAHNIDTDGDGVLDFVEYQNGTDVNSSDSDGDGISDYNELYISNTDPLNADTDGDGFSDYEELFVLFSDPNAVDITNSITEIASVAGSSANPFNGEWLTTGNSIYAISSSGSLEYTINVPEDGVYRLAVEVTEYNRYSNSSTFSLGLAVDDAFVANATVVAPYGSVGDAVFYLPNLKAGEHNFRLIWNNITFDTFIQINNVRLQKVDGPDNNGNGIPDWIDNRLAESKKLTVPPTTKTSPVCIEGKNHLNIGTLLISGYYTPEGEEPVDPVLKHAPDNKWYSDVTLNPDYPTVLDFNFQNGAGSEQKSCEWIETNVLQDENMEIRLGDSLLFTAFPEEAVSGNAVVKVEYEDHNIEYDVNNTRNSFVYKFEVEGDYTVSATYTPAGGGETVTGTMNVKVVSSSFSYIPVAILNESRDWANPNIADEAEVDADTYLNLYEAPIASGGRIFDITVSKNKTGYVIARLGEDGPIMDSKSVKVMEIEFLPTYKAKVIETFSDGSMLIENYIVLSYVPEGLMIHLEIFVAGYTFEDGTIEKWLTADDFDEFGVCKYRIIRSPDARTGVCHKVSIYQNGILLKKY